MRHEIAVAKPIPTTLAMAFDHLTDLLAALHEREAPYDKMALTIGRMSVPVGFSVTANRTNNEFALVIEARLPRKMLYPRFEGTLRVRTVGGFGAEIGLDGVIEMPVAGVSSDEPKMAETRDACNRALEVMTAWLAAEVMNRVHMTPERFAQRRRMERNLGISQS